MTLKSLAAAAFIFFAAASAGSAATFNIVGSFSGGELGDVAFDVTIDADFSADIASTSSGLTINSLTSSEVGGDPFPVSGGLGYQYSLAFDILDIGGTGGGGIRAFSSNDTDFIFIIRQFSSSTPVFSSAFDTISTSGSSATPRLIPSGSVTEVSAVPLPAGFLLLLSGLGGVAALKRRNKRAA